jgi:hypothetical protein
MNGERFVMRGRSTTGKSNAQRTVRVTHYTGGWGVQLAIGDGNGDAKAKAAIELEPRDAVVLAKTLLDFAAKARAARP